MFRRNKPASTKSAVAKRDTIPSIITKDVNILGNIISEGNVDFDGTIQGNIRCNTLTVRADGFVTGDISAHTVHIYGKVNGIIRVKNANFYASCQVQGVIRHETLVIEDGAFIDGKFKRTDKMQSSDDADSHRPVLMLAEEDEESADNNGSTMRPFDTLRLIR